MKNMIKSIGKAVVYFSVYFLTQILISFIWGVILTMKILGTGEEIDEMIMIDRITMEILDQAMLMTLIAGVITLLIYWVVFAVRRKKFLKEVAVRAIPVNGIVPIAVMAVSFNVITSVLLSVIPWPQSWMDSYTANSSAIDSSLISWITAVIMAPVLEEIVFRGLMYTRLKKGMPAIAAAILTSLAFGAAHGTIIWAIYTFIFSMVLIWVFERFQSLTACIILHMAYNVGGMALSLIPEEAGIIVLILFVVSIIAVVVSYKQTVKVTEDMKKIEENAVEEVIFEEEAEQVTE